MNDGVVRASIIMVAFGGGWQWVPRALEALRRNTTEPYEVILVDNGGSDDRPVPDGANVDIIRNEVNVGLGPASNQGVARARGPVVCLLNTDALVEPGWLEPLLERALGDDVGAVFPAKLNLDWTMQEAGAFVTGEANAYVFGDGDDPDLPEFGFPRDVDFGSAAAMCMTRSRFLDAGGFDPAYRLAYYEDADLCFRLRDERLRLVYEPRSRVLHARSISAPSAELVEVSAANRRIFQERWQSTIEGRPFWEELRSDPRVRLEARDLHARHRVLLVGVSERLVADLASAHPRARVTFLVEQIDPSSRRALLESGVEVLESDPQCDWLAERAGHYTHVVLGEDEASLRLRSAVRPGQPQAHFLDQGQAIELENG
jgi:GT2 family glycosyltransferase